MYTKEQEKEKEIEKEKEKNEEVMNTIIRVYLYLKNLLLQALIFGFAFICFYGVTGILEGRDP